MTHFSKQCSRTKRLSKAVSGSSKWGRKYWISQTTLGSTWPQNFRTRITLRRFVWRWLCWISWWPQRDLRIRCSTSSWKSKNLIRRSSDRRMSKSFSKIRINKLRLKIRSWRCFPRLRAIFWMTRNWLTLFRWVRSSLTRSRKNSSSKRSIGSSLRICRMSTRMQLRGQAIYTSQSWIWYYI